MEKKDYSEKIDLIAIINKIWARKKIFYKVIPITFIISVVFILGYPRYYITNIKLAPELNNSSNSIGTLNSIASSFGLDLSEMQTTDAITPLLYPNLMEDNKFICELFNIKVKSVEVKSMTYYDYLSKEQKPVIWQVPVDWLKELFKKKATPTKEILNPYHLDKDKDDIAQAIRGNISIKVDKKTAIINIETKAQDPVISKTIADSVKKHLQEFITIYRTNKACNDYEYYKKLTNEAKDDYEKARQEYASMSDASTNISLKSAELKLEDLENDLQLKFNTYTTLNNQLQAAKAKVQERTPAFTVIKGAEVPLKPSGPKRMLFVIACLFVTFIVTCIYILFQDGQLKK